jgi:hypothetical protein
MFLGLLIHPDQSDFKGVRGERHLTESLEGEPEKELFKTAVFL